MDDTLPPLLDPAALDLDDDQDLLVGIALWAEGEGRLAEDLAAALRGRSPARMRALVELGDQEGLDLNAFTQALALLVPPCAEDAATWRAVATAGVPAEPAVLYNLALDLRTGVRAPDAALPLYQRVVAADPADLDAWLELGCCHEELGRVEPALTAWERAAQVDPASPWPWLNRAQLLRAQQRHAEALAASTRAVARTDDPETWHVHGHLLQLAGRAEEGAAALARAIAGYDAREADADTLFWRGAARARLGQAEAALADLDAAVALDPALAEEARSEEDYAPLRGDPRFPG